jgi:hypothetical protein
MTTDAAALKLAGKPDRPLLRVLLYYVVLFGTAAAIVYLAPEALIYLNAPPPTSALFSGGPGPDVASTTPLGLASGPLRVVIATVVSLTTACALMLPVTWVYVQTRRKKGFDQSVVQTLIILPLVVAGVILLVQNSTALAFSLGGIVGAVSFRNTLRDTKDAIYIFLAIVVGVAAGVHAMLVAATISVCFNLVTVIMWWNNFGRSGAPLEGAPARDRLAQAKAIANRTQGFISMVDRELLRSMSPEQLQALTERARARQQKAEAKAGLGPSPDFVRDRILRIEVGADPEARPAAEGALANTAKRYEIVSEEAAGDGLAIVYQVRLKKSSSAPEFLERLRAAAGSAVRKAELID